MNLIIFRKRSYLKSIRILLPKSWTYSAEPAVAETAEDAEFVVNTVNPAYGHNPYTVQVCWSAVYQQTDES